MSGTGSDIPSGTNIVVNGHEVPLFASNANDAPSDASRTDWVIVKFDRFVDYEFKQELARQHLEVYENLGNDSYLCKYSPQNLAPIANLEAVSHLALYPDSAVPVVDIRGLDSEHASISVSSSDTKDTATGVRMPYVLALHPNPKQTPAEVLEKVRDEFGAEHIDDEISGDTIRVKLDPALISDVSKIDSIRAIANVEERTLFSVRQRAIMQFSQAGINSNYKGNGEIVFIADTGFDMGVTDNVHPAFTGRVHAATTTAGATVSSDLNGHGTHVAGSVLGNLNRTPGTDMYNVEGTAPEANLISMALNFGRFPTTLGLLTQRVGDYGPPLIMNNSWGNRWIPSWTQQPYGIDDATIVDKVMYENPDACLLFAAGNDGAYVGKNGLQQQIGNFAAAKNCITVGASYSDRPLDPGDWAYEAGGRVHSTSEMTVFSSTGPTVEGRLAPDVVAPGAVILSARSRKILPENLQEALLNFGNPVSDDLLFMDGTSMSTPAVTGCVAVLRGAFRDQQGSIPTGALLKALIIHGAVDLIGTPFKLVSNTQSGSSSSKQYTMTAAPNPFQGYGRVDINNSLFPIIGPITGQRGFVDGSFSTGPSQRVYTVTVPANATSLTVTLAYSDLPGVALRNQIGLKVKLSDGSTRVPLTPTDPVNRGITWTPSNVAKVLVRNPRPGPADIYLDVKTGEETAKFAVVWTVGS